MDLIITRKGEKFTEISEPLSDYFISDHCFVSCRVEQRRPPLNITTVKSRNWKNTNSDSSHEDLSDLNSFAKKGSSVNVLVSEFNMLTSVIVDKHAPITEKTIVCRPNVPWYSNYLRMLKQFKRSVETRNVFKKRQTASD